MGEGKKSHPKPENTSHMGMFSIFGWGGDMGGYEAEHHKPSHLDWVFCVLDM